MGDSTQHGQTGTAVGRRQFLRKAAVAGTVVWTVPTILSLEPASADVVAHRHSAPPNTTPVEPTIGGIAAPPPAPTQVAAAKRRPTAQLPFTGDNEEVSAAVGLAAVVAGATLIAAVPREARTVRRL